MRNLTKLMIILGVGLSLVTSLFSSGYCKPMKVVSGFARSSPHAAIEWWGSQVEQATKGKVSFRYLWGGAVSKPFEELDAIRTGLADIGLVLVQLFPSKLMLNNFSIAVPLGAVNEKLLSDIILKVYDKVPALEDEF